MKHYDFNGFTYYERLDLEIQEILPGSLTLDEIPTTESILFRLLLGTLDFKHPQSEELFRQDISYTRIAEEFKASTNSNPILDWTNNEFGLLDLDFYFKKNRKNNELFSELLIEFSLYFYNKNRCNNISAFLHLYRALEYMSYSFPIAYSSKTISYYTSFDTFKSFFVSKDQGQLKFFREFITAIFHKSILRSRTTIDTFVGEELYDKQKLKIIAKLCQGFEFSENGSTIQIEYKFLLDFMINLRNKYFHFQFDRGENISNINFDSELFFEALNDKFANWLSMIYLEIVIQGVYKLNLMPPSK